MHNAAERLSVCELYDSPGITGDGSTADITRSLIANTIKRMHSSAICDVFAGNTTESTSFPTMPTFEVLKPY